MKSVRLLAVLALLAGPGLAVADEEAPKSQRWMLGLTHGPLKIVTVEAPEGRTLTYHYIVLRITNETGLPRDWFPLVKALTDTNRSYVAMGYEHALPDVRAAEGDEDLVAISATKGKIEPGQTLETAAIFGPIDPLYDTVRVQVIGLADPIAIYKVERYEVTVETPGVAYTQTGESGEAEPISQALTIQDIAYVDRNRVVQEALKKAVGEGEVPKPAVQYWEVRERRAYEMVFTRPGDEFGAHDDEILPGGEHWIVVGDVRLERQIKM